MEASAARGFEIAHGWYNKPFRTRMFRRCFVPILAEHALAADLLSRAADALLHRDLPQAEALLRESNLSALKEYRLKITGKINPDIHGRTDNPVYTPISPRSGPCMPTAAVTRQLLARDGYRCRFCGCKIIVQEARRTFRRIFPVAAFPNGERNHAALALLTASMDHVLPIQRGGTNEPDNIVTSCAACQFGRGHWLLEEAKLEDPRQYPPVVDDWDGLTRLRRFDWRAFVSERRLVDANDSKSN